VYVTDGEAQAAAEAWGWKIAPLYLAARLTDAEREAVERGRRLAATRQGSRFTRLGICGCDSATLRGLLERLGGDR
jgi:hypothetical protein